MFILACHNQDGLPTSTYQWRALIGGDETGLREIASGTVKHRRADGWEALVVAVARAATVKAQGEPA